jgi:hypothetical protein
MKNLKYNCVVDVYEKKDELDLNEFLQKLNLTKEQVLNDKKECLENEIL